MKETFEQKMMKQALENLAKTKAAFNAYRSSYWFEIEGRAEKVGMGDKLRSSHPVQGMEKEFVQEWIEDIAKEEQDRINLKKVRKNWKKK